jgi:hypothetical protein
MTDHEFVTSVTISGLTCLSRLGFVTLPRSTMRNSRRLTTFLVGTGLVLACSKPADSGTAGASAVGTPPPPPRSYRMAAALAPDPGCVHLDDPYSNWICPDTARKWFLPADVLAETLVVRLKNGTTQKIGLAPRTDAIFITQSAVETFLLRHYDATDTVKAAQLRQARGMAP